MKNQTKHISVRNMPIEYINLVKSDNYVTFSRFLIRAVKEKLEREGYLQDIPISLSEKDFENKRSIIFRGVPALWPEIIKEHTESSFQQYALKAIHKQMIEDGLLNA